MAVTPDQPAPYAPASAILNLIERHRSKGLPSPVDIDVLRRAGVSESLAPRTLQAMSLLDLLGEDGRPSETLERIRLAPESEFQQRLLEWLDAAYYDARQFVDPATDDDTKVRDAFRNYRPIGQQDRMVSLFLGLYDAAGVVTQRASAPTKPRRAQPASTKTREPRKPPVANHHFETSGGSALQARTGNPDLHPAIAGLLTSLPPVGSGWTRQQRDRFTATFGALLDFCYPIHTGQDDPPDAGERQ